jgi:cyclopropane-fatty-acyl-phospholipid synthase
MELDVMNSSHATVPAADRPSGEAGTAPPTKSAAAALAPLLGSLFGGRLPVRFEFWDGSSLGPRDGLLDLARLRVKEAGLEEQIEIRVQDYRDVRGERFDAISSVGMFEHVGAEKMAAYFSTLHALLADTGRLLNHAISSIGGSRMRRRSFIGRFVFPDGELIDVGQVVGAMERAGFEVRDVESLREHYARTLRAWVANLESNWDEAVAEVGPQRARVWHLYMAASANGFDDGGISLHQVLGVRPTPEGQSAMPPTRSAWL